MRNVTLYSVHVDSRKAGTFTVEADAYIVARALAAEHPGSTITLLREKLTVSCVWEPSGMEKDDA